MILIIEKEANNVFSLTYDGGQPIRTEQNRLTTVGDFTNFKTANGANLILKQNIFVEDITVISSGSFNFTDINDLWNKLIEIGFFDGVANSGGGSFIDRFDELSDTFDYFGRDGQVVTVNESQLRLETQPISLFTPADRDKLDGIQAEAEVNVQADASVTDPNDPAYIKNFPNIPDIGADKENTANKQNSLAVDGTGVKFSTVDAVNEGLDTKSIRSSIFFSGKDIDFFGDSYTVGSGASSTSKRWSTVLSNILVANEINHGVAGTTIQKRTPVDYLNAPNMVDNVANIPTKTATKAMLVFAFGLNDLGQTAPDYNIANFKIDYQFVLNNAFSKGWLPSQILVIPPYYIGATGYAFYNILTGNPAPTQARHLSFIQAAKEVANLNNTMYFDIYQDQVKNDINLLVGDGIHPNDLGHAYIAFDILKYLGADKIGLTINTTFDLKSGFIPNLSNGNTLTNSLIYDSGNSIGIGTVTPSSTLHINSLTNYVEQRFTNNATGTTISDGSSISIDDLGDFRIGNLENKDVVFFTNKIPFSIFKRDQKFGIGTLDPLFKMHLLASNNDGIKLESSNSTFVEISKIGSHRWRIQNDYNSANSLEINYGNNTEPSSNILTFFNDGRVNLSSLAGAGTRLVSASPTGQLGAITILPVFADNTAAIAGGLGVGALYRTAAGLLAIVF